jgi:hypothetical protein
VNLPVLIYQTSNTPILTFYSDDYLHIGSNALRALQGLGLLEAILAKVNQSAGPGQHVFVFVSGTGDHELVYDVCFVNTAIENKLKF